MPRGASKLVDSASTGKIGAVCITTCTPLTEIIIASSRRLSTVSVQSRKHTVKMSCRQWVDTWGGANTTPFSCNNNRGYWPACVGTLAGELSIIILGLKESSYPGAALPARTIGSGYEVICSQGAGMRPSQGIRSSIMACGETYTSTVSITVPASLVAVKV